MESKSVQVDQTVQMWLLRSKLNMATVLTWEETFCELCLKRTRFQKGGRWGCNVTQEMLFGKHAVVILQTQTESSGKISTEVL